ncbi:MAG: hypothetical protein Q8830_00555 [Candidatus Phytoplasma australasiaticum]|nr:hypothetical protein [Candidatus Phytoplasma australasiaticum]
MLNLLQYFIYFDVLNTIKIILIVKIFFNKYLLCNNCSILRLFCKRL